MASWEWDIPSHRVEISGTLGAVIGLAGAPPTPLYPNLLADVHQDDRA
jgi:hypothetical protein